MQNSKVVYTLFGKNYSFVDEKSKNMNKTEMINEIYILFAKKRSYNLHFLCDFCTNE